MKCSGLGGESLYHTRVEDSAWTKSDVEHGSRVMPVGADKFYAGSCVTLNVKDSSKGHAYCTKEDFLHGAVTSEVVYS